MEISVKRVVLQENAAEIERLIKKKKKRTVRVKQVILYDLKCPRQWTSVTEIRTQPKWTCNVIGKDGLRCE